MIRAALIINNVVKHIYLFETSQDVTSGLTEIDDDVHINMIVENGVFKNAPDARPVETIRFEKMDELTGRFEQESIKDVITSHGTFSGGSMSALERSGVADVASQRGRPTGDIHDVNHDVVTLNINELKDVAADIAEAQALLSVNYHAKMKEVVNCGENSICINNIIW